MITGNDSTDNPDNIWYTFLNSWDSNKIDTSITGITFNPESLTNLDYSKYTISRGTDEVDFSPVDKEYATDFSSSTFEKGLNPEEFVSVHYACTDAGCDILELVSALRDSALSTIELNVQMIGSSGSSSGLYVLKSIGDPVPIPEPATMLLLGTGLVGIAAVTRKRYNI